MTTAKKAFIKQPDDELDYSIDLSNWMPDNDKATSASVSVDSGITHTSTTVEDKNIKVWLKGGKDGNTYKVSVEIDTNGGRVKEVDFQVKVRERGN